MRLEQIVEGVILCLHLGIGKDSLIIPYDAVHKVFSQIDPTRFFVGHGRRRITPVILRVAVPDEAVLIAYEFVIMHIGGRGIVDARRIVLDRKRLVIVPRIDHLRIGLRRVLEPRAARVLLLIA